MRWKKKVARALESWSSVPEDGDAPPARAPAIGEQRAAAANGEHAALDLESLERRLGEIVREQRSRASAGANGTTGGGVRAAAAEARLARLEARLAGLREGSSATGAAHVGARVAEPDRAPPASPSAEELAVSRPAQLEPLRAELARLIGEFAAERARIATHLSEAAHEQHRHGQRLGLVAGDLATLQDRLAWHASDVERVGRQAQRARHLAWLALVLGGGAFVVAAVREVLAALGRGAG